ncbi:hypothetical protein BGZ97_004237 [Linnemannia gamsii]|uniref:Uncharacterized protein n=1 Tax=Linnemannia gamsii TaxID=64522 RepID=A0A9P6QWX6_9FUNG|nr:hypothetical protein BGZ97_004237 [Linnemannia gamsii]
MACKVLMGTTQTISWSNFCSDFTSDTASVDLAAQHNPGIIQFVSTLGQANCKTSHTVVITVPADIPPGDFYVILIQNTPSDSFSPIFTIIDPITPTQITPTLSSTKPTVPTLSSDTPKPTSYDPSEGDSKSNGAAIGGGIAGVVIHEDLSNVKSVIKNNRFFKGVHNIFPRTIHSKNPTAVRAAQRK